jgi:hypothetical protein
MKGGDDDAETSLEYCIQKRQGAMTGSTPLDQAAQMLAHSTVHAKNGRWVGWNAALV